MEIYRGLASEAYVAIASNDPVDRAFTLCAEIRRIGEIEIEFKVTYNELEINMERFATEFIEQARTTEEVRPLCWWCSVSFPWRNCFICIWTMTINTNPLGILSRNLQCTCINMPLSSKCTVHFRWSFIFSTCNLYFLPGSNVAPFEEVKVPVSNSAEFFQKVTLGGFWVVRVNDLILPHTDVCIALHTQCFPSVCEKNFTGNSTSCLLVQTC